MRLLINGKLYDMWLYIHIINIIYGNEIYINEHKNYIFYMSMASDNPNP